MISTGFPGRIVLDDGWTVIIGDEKLTAQYEHTVALIEPGVHVMTVQNDEGSWEPRVGDIRPAGPSIKIDS